jgi:hypothetical protein
MSIVTNCMIANLQLGVWTGHRLDKAASKRVTDEAGAEDDAARVNKHLVPKEALKAISNAQGQIRLHFYDRTLPWKDNGDRILTRAMYQRFIEEHGALKDKFNDAVLHFLKVEYPVVVQKAEFRMGELFKKDDYPTPRELKDRFYANLDIDAVTEAKDFRVSLDKADREQVKSDIESAMQRRLVEAQKHVWNRLSETMGHFTERMKNKDAKFKAATIENLAELADILPGLNVVSDPELDHIAKQIKALVDGCDPKAIRDNDKQRKAIGKEAQAIMNDIGGFMKAFGGGK